MTNLYGILVPMANRDPYTVALAATLRAERARAGWTIEEMAERSDLNYETLRRMLRAERDISMDSLRRVAEGLGVAPSYLLSDAESRMGTSTDRVSPGIRQTVTDPRTLLHHLLDNPDNDDVLMSRLTDATQQVGERSSRAKQLADRIRHTRHEELKRALEQLPSSENRAAQ